MKLIAWFLAPTVTCVVLLCLMACRGSSSGGYDRIDRHLFNRTAVRLNLPVFWTADSNDDGAINPSEVVALLFYDQPGHWVVNGAFTPEFEAAYEAIVAAADAPLPRGLDEAEASRRELVRQDLDHGIATLVLSELDELPADHQRFVDHILAAAELVDRLAAEMNGTAALAHLVPADDSESQSLFRRNRGPACVAPRTYQNPACSAIPGAPPISLGIYPAALQQREGFCELLARHPDADRLTAPFTVVREAAGEFVAVPLTDAYGDLTQPIAAELRGAAEALTDPAEEALRSYLEAAARAFVDNDWEPADEAWAAMNARNSRWYLRVAPDEVYWEPCALKAGVHLSLALINTDSLAWQDRLTPVRQEMEDSLAALIGSPYEARTVSFHLPDFIDVVVNAGDDRVPLGATIGQSLPNWGPVANEGRGRTVAMSNLYTDPDSLASKRTQAASLLSPETMQVFTTDATPSLLNTILHEAAHNLGPAHEYRVDGKVDSELFGGGMASLLEELKAQTAALWLVDFLHQRQLISTELARQSYLDGMTWAFGHIARGMYTAGGNRKAYSQLAAIQVGMLLEHGALRFDNEAVAANGSDRGAFTIDFARMKEAVAAMMKTVGTIKARGELASADALAATHVDGESVPQALIAERILRHPKASFVYAVKR